MKCEQCRLLGFKVCPNPNAEDEDAAHRGVVRPASPNPEGAK